MTENQKERVHAQTQQMYSEAIVINAILLMNKKGEIK